MTNGSFRVEFVCTGNICRSPFAEYYARSVWTRAIDVSSSGIAAVTGHPATTTMRSVATGEFGLDLDGHRARQIPTRDDIDLFLVMADDHLEYARRHAPPGARVQKLSIDGIPDPYGLDRGAYLETANLITAAIDRLDMAIRVS